MSDLVVAITIPIVRHQTRTSRPSTRLDGGPENITSTGSAGVGSATIRYRSSSIKGSSGVSPRVSLGGFATSQPAMLAVLQGESRSVVITALRDPR
jgi:hypothetical protein